MTFGRQRPIPQGQDATDVDARLKALLTDLSERVSGLEREIADLDLIEAERADITLAERLAAARGTRLFVQTCRGGHYDGILRDSAARWLQLQVGERLVVIAHHAIATVSGLGRASAVVSKVEAARTFAAICRRIAARRSRVQIQIGDREVAGVIAAVGGDFVELRRPDREVVSVAIGAISVLEAWGVNADGSLA